MSQIGRVFDANSGNSEVISNKILICFSHLRWDFVWQRPQHLMSRFARQYTVLFWEEPLACADGQEPSVHLRRCERSNVLVATPMVPAGLAAEREVALLRSLLDAEVARFPSPAVRW